MYISFERFTMLQYELKAAQRKAAAFESGKRYTDLQAKAASERRYLESVIRALKKELEQSHQENRQLRKYWLESTEDLDNEYKRKIAARDRTIKRLRQEKFAVENERDRLKDALHQKQKSYYEIAGKLQDAEERIQKLTAQINRDFENSSVPSSAQGLRRKKIPNSRVRSGRKPGAQPGHPWHGRKRHEPSKVIELTPSQEILDDPDYRKTNKTIVKQVVNLRVYADVTEYRADVYRNSKTGETYHAEFPTGAVNDVNYGGSVKAFLFLLNQKCCVSIDKCSSLLSDLTGGKLKVSKGMINRLSREFARKGARLRKEMVSDIYLSPVIHTDCTYGRVNGSNVYVYVCAPPEGLAYYFAREKKGHEGVKGSPVEDYQGILVHDHEKTFFNYGTGHQDCIAHVLRYLKGSMENEPERTWNQQMHGLLREMVHYVNGHPDSKDRDPDKVADFKTRYDEILQTAYKEYGYVPCSDYYREGYNLALRLGEYRDAHLLFLDNDKVPPTNNTAERHLRSFKRKQNQAVTFRSFKSVEELCECMSMLIWVRQKETGNFYENISAMFN